MSFQNSINSALGTIALGATASKHMIQQDKAERLNMAKIVGELKIEKDTLASDIKKNNELVSTMHAAQDYQDMVKKNKGNILVGPDKGAYLVDEQRINKSYEAMKMAESKYDEFVKTKGLQNKSFAERLQEFELKRSLTEQTNPKLYNEFIGGNK